LGKILIYKNFPPISYILEFDLSVHYYLFMDKKIQKFEIIGAIFSILVGSLLHFVYKWSGSHPLVAIIAAVNESTWEHLKLGFWPLLFWGILEYFIFGKQIRNFFFGI